MTKFESFMAGIWLGGICGMITIGIIKSGEPTPKDVYRGRTTLEITYRDSIPVDSVVVFKKEAEK